MAEFKGDANKDGRIDIQDIRVAMRIVSGLLEINENDKTRVDVDDDGNATLEDVQKILDHINCVNLIDGVIY
jgi:biopolymer transport protein ExbD